MYEKGEQTGRNDSGPRVCGLQRRQWSYTNVLRERGSEHNSARNPCSALRCFAPAEGSIGVRSSWGRSRGQSIHGPPLCRPIERVPLSAGLGSNRNFSPVLRTTVDYNMKHVPPASGASRNGNS